MILLFARLFLVHPEETQDLGCRRSRAAGVQEGQDQLLVEPSADDARRRRLRLQWLRRGPRGRPLAPSVAGGGQEVEAPRRVLRELLLRQEGGPAALQGLSEKW